MATPLALLLFIPLAVISAPCLAEEGAGTPVPSTAPATRLVEVKKNVRALDSITRQVLQVIADNTSETASRGMARILATPELTVKINYETTTGWEPITYAEITSRIRSVTLPPRGAAPETTYDVRRDGDRLWLAMPGVTAQPPGRGQEPTAKRPVPLPAVSSQLPAPMREAMRRLDTIIQHLPARGAPSSGQQREIRAAIRDIFVATEGMKNEPAYQRAADAAGRYGINVNTTSFRAVQTPPLNSRGVLAELYREINNLNRR